MFRLLLLNIILLFTALLVWADPSLLIAENMAKLNCDMPSTSYRFLGSNMPGQIFLSGEAVNFSLAISKGAEHGVVKDFALEVQEITTRDPAAISKSGFSDTAGYAPLLGLEGKPFSVPLPVTFTADPQTVVQVTNFPLPARFGTYALILTRGHTRAFLATLARVPKPRAEGNIENVPIFGEGQFINGNLDLKAAIYARMGIRGWRSELSWNENADYSIDWQRYDPLFHAAEAHGEKIMVTLGGHPGWSRPFGEPTPASGWTKNSGGYWGSGDWLCDPKWYNRYEHWITTFCYRYWKEGHGALWGLENYNEPWEGGGISGWARDMLQYRELQKHIATAARTVDPRIRLLGACSIMNTEDKFYSDGSNEFDKYIDIFTDHYVPPPMCYGPLVAKAHGKTSMETETWFVNSEFLLPQGVAQFLASGQKRLAPWHPRVLFDELPGGTEQTLLPTPVVAATAALNAMLTGKEFDKVVFHTHLPWVFQFGKDDDKDALLIVFGQLMTIGGSNPKARLWAQVDSAPGGTMTIDNADDLLQFYDLAGNPAYLGQKTVTLPMDIRPTYIKCRKGAPAATARLAKMRIAGKRPLEIIPRDFTQRVTTPGLLLNVDVHNCLNRALSGKLAVTPPPEMTLQASELPVVLAPGETTRVSFTVTKAEAVPANAYAFSFHFTSDAGNADYAEALNAAVAVKRSMKLDGTPEEWQDIPGIMLIAGAEKLDPTELMRRPWLAQAEKQPNGAFGEVKAAWDENNFYVYARVNDPTPEVNPLPMAGRDENGYFHSAADDQREPYKSFLAEFAKKNPGSSFAEVPYVWRTSPESPSPELKLPVIPFRRARLQLGLDVVDDWHDLTPDTDRVPYGFHNVPDTDYEYSLYATGNGASELWRQLAPGVPRIHDWPRQPRGARTTGPVPGAKHLVQREGNVYTYELALPQSEVQKMELKTGATFGFIFKIGNSTGPSLIYGQDKAATKLNGLSLHPYWELGPNCGVRWTLVE